MSKDSKELVTVDLAEIQRIRDALMRLRDYSPMIRQLWIQVAGLYQRLSKSTQQETHDGSRDERTGEVHVR